MAEARARHQRHHFRAKERRDPMAMILAGALCSRTAATSPNVRVVRSARLASKPWAQVFAPADLGGGLGTSGFVDEVIARTKAKLDVWASL